MGYVPPDAKWFLAKIVEAITVGQSPRTVVHLNTLLVRADSAEEAYRAALKLGRRSNARYRNVDGDLVRIRFLGLRDLLVIYEDLEHGSEIAYSERTTRSMQAARSLVSRKRDLGVFAPRSPRPAGYPNYVAADIQERLEKATGRPMRPRKRDRRKK